jgi:tRNA 2-selenouridine synthase
MAINSNDFLNKFDPHKDVLVDVRSEGEFFDGHLRGAINIPILKNEHRHLVGICYKENGQEAAIKLGHELVDPIKPELQQRWVAAVKGKTAYLHCWRGGLRSRISSEWIREVGGSVETISGGYKEVRKRLLQKLSANHDFVLLSGLTGSGKTHFLHEFKKKNTIDLEALANHRGSAFGGAYSAQPSQQTFENALGYELLNITEPFLLEDESVMIGSIKIPDEFYARMKISPCVILELDQDKRAENIYRDYIVGSKMAAPELAQFMRNNLVKIKSRLGGKRYQDTLYVMDKAFAHESPEFHREWVRMLLEFYYDPLYQRNLKKIKERVLFQGEWQELYEFINHHLSRSRTR